MAGNVVFISYAHESEEHRVRVLELARALLRVGWDVRLDRYVGHPDGGWPRWMASQIDVADRILCICTPTYRRRFEGEQARHGLGVSWEGYLITGMLYRERGRSERVIPVWPDGHDASALPRVLQPLPGLAFDVDAIVARLGTVGAERGEPTLAKGHDFGAMDPHRALGQLYRPIRARSGGAGPLDVPPSTFLRAEHAIVPFHGRGAELAALDAWCQGGDVRVRVVHGVGGAGKTRLALELSARRATEGWRAGPLVPGALTWEVAEALVRDPIPLLVCVDYAETRLPEVELLLKQAAASATGPVRIVLLARQVGEWMDTLARAVPDLPELLDEPLRVQGQEWFEVNTAAQTFASYLHRPMPSGITGSRATPLDAQVDALLAVQGEAGRGVEALAVHEEKYLLAAATAWGVRPAVTRLLPKAVALATLAQGWAHADALGWLRAIPEVAAELPADVAQALAVLAAVYPSDDGGIAPVRPDRVGEVYVARQDPEGVLGGVACDRGRAVEALTVLTRLAQRGGAEGPLRGVLALHWTTLGEPIIDVALATGDPIGRWTAELLEAAGDVEWARGVEGRLPYPTTALLELAEVVTRLRVGSAEDGDEAALASRAAYQNNLGLCLRDLGRHGEALAEMEKAVDGYRRLAEARPDAFLPDLAISLNNLGLPLAYLGRQEDALATAEEAVDVLRRLAEFRPDAFLHDLAMSLANLGLVLFSLGRREEALAATEEAVNILRRLAVARPDAFLPDLSSGLNNLGIRLSALGRREEALAASEEAVGLRRRLAGSRPDAFLPDLARSLNNLSLRLSHVGRDEEALAATQEAVDIDRRLAEARPDVFLPNLAGSLSNLGSCLSALGRQEEALVATGEASQLDRHLAPARAVRFFSEIAKRLGRHGQVLGGLDRHTEAAAAFAEAMGLVVPLVRRVPKTYEELALALMRDHLAAAQAGSIEPDHALLAQLNEALANPPKS